jgi:hypothetical protein
VQPKVFELEAGAVEQVVHGGRNDDLVGLG